VQHVFFAEDPALWSSAIVFLSVLAGVVCAYWFGLRKRGARNAEQEHTETQTPSRLEVPAWCVAGWQGRWQHQFPKERDALRIPVRDAAP
jgi:hypothetical protein